jgi:glyoxylase-like metal-dependent hydrolase (beta-lactamase superfamily II)
VSKSSPEATVSYPLDGLPDSGTATEAAPGVRWLRMPLPFALDHINLWLVAEGDCWAAVDTGLGNEEIRAYWRTLLAEHPLSRIVVTHLHPDHLGLAAWLQEETGTQIWMTLGEFASAHLMHTDTQPWSIAATQAFFLRHGLPIEKLASFAADKGAYRRGIPSLPVTYQRLNDGDRLRIGDHDWEIIVGYGHSPEHASLYCDDLHVLISGDMLLPRITTNVGVAPQAPEVDGLRLYLQSIARLRRLPADTLVLPSHGRPFHGLHARIDHLEAHHAARCDALIARCAEPRTAAELLATLFDRALSDGHQYFFAMGECIAHLNHLVQLGRLRRIESADVIRFIVAR